MNKEQAIGILWVIIVLGLVWGAALIVDKIFA